MGRANFLHLKKIQILQIQMYSKVLLTLKLSYSICNFKMSNSTFGQSLVLLISALVTPISLPILNLTWLQYRVQNIWLIWV